MTWYINDKIREYWAYASTCFSPEECDQIINFGSKLELKESKINTKDSTSLNKNYRKSNVAFFDHQEESIEWVFKRLGDIVFQVNQKFWEYELQFIETLQFTMYKAGDFDTRHTDHSKFGPTHRKLSFVVQLSDPDTYEGGDLVMHYSREEVAVNRGRGDVIFFPSHTLHEVKPLISGERYSLVGWVCGPPFK